MRAWNKSHAAELNHWRKLAHVSQRVYELTSRHRLGLCRKEPNSLTCTFGEVEDRIWQHYVIEIEDAAFDRVYICSRALSRTDCNGKFA